MLSASLNKTFPSFVFSVQAAAEGGGPAAGDGSVGRR